MEVAGLGVAEAVTRYIRDCVNEPYKEIAILCGPGNNGGDGLVAARYLTLFGEKVFVVLPKVKRDDLFPRLLTLLHQCDIEVISDVSQNVLSRIKNSSVIIDALFGFGFTGELREPFCSLMTVRYFNQRMVCGISQNVFSSSCSPKVVSVDVPSGWSVNDGPVGNRLTIHPDCVVSLTAPKKCMREYKGTHYIAGRFVPHHVAEKYNLKLANYTGSEMVVKLH